MLSCRPIALLLALGLSACVANGHVEHPKDAHEAAVAVGCTMKHGPAPSCPSGGSACAALTALSLRCARGVSINQATPLPEMNALALFVGDRTLLLLDAKTLALTSLVLPAHFRTVKPFARGGVLWLVASDEQSVDNVLLSYRAGEWSSLPIRLPADARPSPADDPPRAYAEVVALRWGDGTKPPRLWLRSQQGEAFEVDAPAVAVRSSDAPPAPSRDGVASPPDDVTRSAVPSGRLRSVDFRVEEESDERACRARRLVSELIDDRRVDSVVRLADRQTWAAVRRTRRVTERVQSIAYRPVDPLKGRSKPPPFAECVWDQKETETDAVLELATVDAGYHPEVVMTEGLLLGAIGTDLFVVIRDPDWSYEDPTFHIVKVDTLALRPRDP